MVVFIPLATIAIVSGIVEFFVASNFVLQWRRWMTASFTSRWLTHSMHYKLALSANAAEIPLKRRRKSSRSARPNRQPRSAHLAGHRRLHQRHRYGHQFRQRRHLQLHHPGDRFGDQSGLVLDHPVGDLQLAQCADLRLANPRLSVLGRGPLRLYRDGHHPTIGRSLSRLYFRQQAVEANFRFDLARIREYSEQIALLKGEDREIDRAGSVFGEVCEPSAASSMCARGSSPSISSTARYPSSFLMWSSPRSTLRKSSTSAVSISRPTRSAT